MKRITLYSSVIFLIQVYGYSKQLARMVGFTSPWLMQSRKHMEKEFSVGEVIVYPFTRDLGDQLCH